MSSQHIIEDDRAERDPERIAADSLESSADEVREAAKEHLRAYNDTLVRSGKPFPTKGKAAAILRELIAVEGYSLSENHLIQVSGTDYITSSVAALRDMGWIIASSRRFVRGRGGRHVQKTCYSLDPKNNGITLNS